MRNRLFIYTLFIYLSSMFVSFTYSTDFLEEIFTLFYNKKWSQVEPLLLERISTEPSNGELLSLLADTYLAQNRFQEALQHYQDAKQFLATNAYENYRIGQVYIKLKLGEEAFNAFQQSYAEDPTNLFNLFQLGYVSLYFLRDKKSTIQYWSTFIVKAPNDPQRDKIERILALLRDPNFTIPPIDSDILLEEVLLLGGKSFKLDSANTKNRTEGNEKSKNKNNIHDLLDDDDL